MARIARAISLHPTPVRRLLRPACGTAIFLAFGFLGRAAVIDHQTLTPVWVAAGVAALWLSSGDRETWPGDAAALASATFAVNVLTGASVAAAAAFTVSNLMQVGVFVLLARRWTGHVWGLGGAEPLHRLVDLGRLVGVSLCASFVGAGTGVVGLAVTAGGSYDATFLLWWGRNSVSVLVLTVFGLLAGPPLFAASGPRDLGRILARAVRARSFGRLLEAELLVATSVGLYGLLFGQRDAQPLSFLVLAVSVWAGLRFPPLAVVAHGVAAGGAGLLFTISDIGPFASIESVVFRALVAQVFIATTVLTGLALAFSRLERDDANARLAEAQSEADERARLLGAVLESMNEGLVVVEEGGRVLVSNAASKELLGIDEVRDQLRPAGEYALFHDDGTPLADEELPGLLALHGEEVPARDFHLRADSVPAGRVLEIGARPVPRLHPDDPPRGMVNIRDVTVDRQHRDALASFAGDVAHDLFSPLTIVSGWAETLEEELAEGSLQPSVGLPMLRRLREATNRMRDIIGDLLAYTVARDQSLRLVAVDLTAELRSLALMRIGAPGHPLVAVAPGLRVWGDAGLVRQLFENLLGNAVKYVAPGTRPRVDVRGRSDGDWLEILVTDNGIGIPEDQRDQVFETFHRVHDGYQGTGLGLAICRRIADRHGGSIHAKAGPDGTGTTFVVRLPATSAGFAPDPARAADEPPIRRAAGA